ncbi:hypothetical protein IFM89_022608 [Coptis chinensis]|uniref:Malic enzyme n=1 Tax=Coptis chinensis TaxID=261450 RepID=A0A835M965_9MAGN|nr:hypothetical protein IFM89_022608 [Coptis chinensis]
MSMPMNVPLVAGNLAFSGFDCGQERGDGSILSPIAKQDHNLKDKSEGSEKSLGEPLRASGKLLKKNKTKGKVVVLEVKNASRERGDLSLLFTGITALTSCGQRRNNLLPHTTSELLKASIDDRGFVFLALRKACSSVTFALSSNGRGGGVGVENKKMESTLKEISNGASVLDMESNSKSCVGGGVEDFYGEDHATEDQFVTPWTISVASGYSLLRDPHHNKGLAFTGKERDAHYLRGLLPPTTVSQDLQVKKMMHNLREYQVPLQRYVAMMDLQERNERLFYKLLMDNVEELLPVVYTPTVGEACQKYGSIFRRPQGLYISLKEKGKILEVLKNWPERSIQVIVVTDGERILGLGDLGCQCLPITIDVGTNNEKLLNDEFYIGLRQKRATGQEYSELLHEFMSAVKQNYGEKVLIQFEDFANHNAFELLSKYRTSHLVFNDDIQAGTGIAELIALEMSKQTKAPVQETRKKVWLVDSKGLIVSSRKDSLQHFKQPWAHEHEPVKNLLDAVKVIKPTVLIGTSGVGQTFTKEVVEAMASFNEKPVIFALSNPTSQSECTAEEAYTWSKGRAIFASGSPFDPVEYEGKVYTPGQGNNAYIFPGFGLGLIISGAIRVHDDMLLAASNVAAKVYELGLASRLPRPENLVKYAESCMYSPNYRSYR